MDKKELINQSIEYILQHLNEDIGVKDVADHFHFSEFYFNRVFKAVTGENVYGFIKRLKMDQSAIDIKLKKSKTITDIGLDYGYSPSNYSTAFRQHHCASPTEFRKSTSVVSINNPFHPEKIEHFQSYQDYASKIKFQEIEDFIVIYERMIGDYYELKEKWFQFMDTYKDYIKEDTLMIERFYDDPVIASLNSCICDLCITANKNCTLENVVKIKGGRFATYHFEGQISDIFYTLQGIFSVWLPKSGHEMSERYGLNVYRNIDWNNDSVIMDLYIPIK